MSSSEEEAAISLAERRSDFFAIVKKRVEGATNRAKHLRAQIYHFHLFNKALSFGSVFMASETDQQPQAGWHVVRTRPKGERIAAMHLQKYANLDEVFCPRIRFEKATTRGKVWFVEALFPCYIFARFDIATDLRAVNATSGVTAVLRFADQYPQISDALIRELRTEFQKENDEIRVIEPEIIEGDEIVVIDGAMKGLRTIVTRLMPSQDRIRILMECLGEEREVEVARDSIAIPGNVRKEVKL